MNFRTLQLMRLHKLMAPAGSEGSDTGGTGTGADAEKAAAEKAAAEKADAEKAAAEKAAAEKGISDSEAKLVKDVMKHKGRAQELEKQIADISAKLKAFDGIDVEKMRAMLAEQEALETKRLEAKGDYERLTKQMGERHTQEKTALQQQIEDANKSASSLQAQIAEMTVGGAFSSSKFVSEDLALTPSKTRIIYGSHFEFKDGKVVGYDKPSGASDRTILVNSAGDPLSFDDAMRKIIDSDPERDQLLRSKMRPGSNSTPPKGVKKPSEAPDGNLTSIERIAQGLKKLAIK